MLDSPRSNYSVRMQTKQQGSGASNCIILGNVYILTVALATVYTILILRDEQVGSSFSSCEFAT